MYRDLLTNAVTCSLPAVAPATSIVTSEHTGSQSISSGTVEVLVSGERVADEVSVLPLLPRNERY